MTTMGCPKYTLYHLSALFLLILPSNSANVKDIFNINTPLTARVPRDNKYYPSRYTPGTTNLAPLNRAIKPEDSPEALEATPNPVEKRCSRCDSSYSDSRYPYESRTRYDDRRYRPPYDQDERRYDRYDRYDDRRYDRYDDRERYDRYDRRPGYDRYDRDRYDRDRYDRYDRDRYDRYDRDKYYERDYDRGFGYDNRGYDYRDRGIGDYAGGTSGGGWDGGRGYGGGRPEGGRPEGGRPEGGSGYWGTGGYASGWNYGGGRDDNRDRERYDYDGFKPWDETYRGSSGWDNAGRGYYFASGIPEVGAEHWGTREYSDGGTNGYRDRKPGISTEGGTSVSPLIMIHPNGEPLDEKGYGGYYRPRDPYYDGYRSTSYLYARPSSTTTNRTPNSGDSDNGVTQSPQQDNTSG